MGTYIYRAHIHDAYVINFADASAIGPTSASVVYRYGAAIGDRPMKAFGAWLLANPEHDEVHKREASRRIHRRYLASLTRRTHRAGGRCRMTSGSTTFGLWRRAIAEERPRGSSLLRKAATTPRATITMTWAIS